MDVRTLVPTTAAAAAVFAGALLGASPASAASWDAFAHDPAGDGTPDIVSMSLARVPGGAARVTVKVRGVRTSVNNGMFLYVDPYGTGRAPKYAFVLGLNGAGDYAMRVTNGWRLGRFLAGCGEHVALHQPSAHVRVVTFSLPSGCFSGHGAKFAARTEALNRAGAVVGRDDWTPDVRTLSHRFAL